MLPLYNDCVSTAHGSAREDACQESKCLLNYKRQDKSSKVLVLLKRGRFQNKDILSSQELVNSEKNTGEGKQEGQENRNFFPILVSLLSFNYC